MRLLLAAILLLIFTPNMARAYIDPGTGSYILQIAAAAVLAGIFVIKAFWKNIKKGFSCLVTRSKQKNDDK